MILRAVAYLRVSGRQQEFGIGAQRAVIEAWCAQNDTSIVAWFEEHLPGPTPAKKCPQLLAAIRALETRRATVFIYARRDRFARGRNKVVAIESAVKKRGAIMRSADGIANGDTPADQLLRNIQHAVAEFEWGLICERINAAVKVRRAAGRCLGRPPYGFRAKDGKLVEHPEEQRTIALAQKLRRHGSSLQGVADALNESERWARGRKGKPSKWSQSMVCRLLQKNPI